MSISEISAASVLPVRSSARISVMACRARGPGAVRILASSSSLSPLMTGTSGATAWLSSPSTRPSSSSQCSRPAWTSVKGRRSSPTPPTIQRHGTGDAGRRRTRPTRCPATATELRPTSAIAGGRPRGEMRPLFTEDPDLRLQVDVELRVHALAGDLHQREHVGGHGAAAIDDEVGVLGRDLGAVDALALEPGLLDQLRGQV